MEKGPFIKDVINQLGGDLPIDDLSPLSYFYQLILNFFRKGNSTSLEPFMLAQRANIMIKKKSNLVLAVGLLSSRYAQCVKIPGKNLISLFFVAGENHELHPAKQVQVLGKSISTPSIVVQVCGQEVDEVLYPNSKRIRATKCPERQNSLD